MLRGRVFLQPRTIPRLIWQRLEYKPSWQFVGDVARLIWEYRAYSLAIFVVTVFQESAALWPVTLLGLFIDRLGTGGDIGNVVWLLMAATLLYPGIVRANVMLRHKMFYETDFKKAVELVLKVSDQGNCIDSEAAGAAYTRVTNAVGGIIGTVYHILGSFTPVVVKITIVSGSLLNYNQRLGILYLVSLTIPAFMTIIFNKRLRVLLDSHYSVVSTVSGTAIRTINEKDNLTIRARFQNAMGTKKRVLVALTIKGQIYLYIREATLVGSQFLVVFLALAMRAELSMTPGDFTRIIGYTAQVAAAFIGAASVMDAIISYSRAYHVYATAVVDSQPSPDTPEASQQATSA